MVGRGKRRALGWMVGALTAVAVLGCEGAKPARHLQPERELVRRDLNDPEYWLTKHEGISEPGHVPPSRMGIGETLTDSRVPPPKNAEPEAVSAVDVSPADPSMNPGVRGSAASGEYLGTTGAGEPGYGGEGVGGSGMAGGGPGVGGSGFAGNPHGTDAGTGFRDTVTPGSGSVLWPSGERQRFPRSPHLPLGAEQ